MGGQAEQEHDKQDRATEVAPAPRMPFARIADIERLPEGERWLVEGFLASGSITVLASTPKAGKTWTALALAVGVASGTPALGRFHVSSPGPVLLFHAEDDSRAVRERIESIALGQGIAFDATLPIHVITATTLKLDAEEDRTNLEELLAHLQPKLLVLDPLVRLHAGAESYVGHMAELFGYLRSLQRRFAVAILLTHHVAKNRSGSTQPGQAMRGSGDIHAAYDHGATLQRQADGSVLLSLEHRSAPSPDPIAFRILSKPGGATTFDIIDEPFADDPEPRVRPEVPRASAPTRASTVSVHEQVLSLLGNAPKPLSQVTIRKTLQVRNETLTGILRELQDQGRIENLGRMQGWRITALPTSDSAAEHPECSENNHG